MAEFYTFTISKDAHDILEEMAKEDHVSNITELEMLISKAYKQRKEFDISKYTPVTVPNEDGSGTTMWVSNSYRMEDIKNV